MSPVPYIDEVAGQAARNQEQRVNADVVAVTGVAGRKPLGGDCDPAEAIFIERPGRRFLAAALFNLNEG